MMYIRQDSDMVYSEITMRDAAQFWLKCVEEPRITAEFIGRDRETLKGTTHSENEAFYGSLAEARAAIKDNAFDDAPYRTGVFAKLCGALGIENIRPTRRKRVFSEHDGDWSYERRWDSKPFSSVERVREKKRIIVECDFTISARTSKAEIKDYGVFCFALIRRLEELGHQCDVSLIFRTAKAFSCGGLGLTAKFWIKKAGEYVNVLSFAKYFTDWAYRRIIFAHVARVGHKIDNEVAYGLGACRPHPFEVKRGLIRLTPGTPNEMWENEGKVNKEKLYNLILTATGGAACHGD